MWARLALVYKKIHPFLVLPRCIFFQLKFSILVGHPIDYSRHGLFRIKVRLWWQGAKSVCVNACTSHWYDCVYSSCSYVYPLPPKPQFDFKLTVAWIASMQRAKKQNFDKHGTSRSCIVCFLLMIMALVRTRHAHHAYHFNR